jgi:integrase
VAVAKISKRTVDGLVCPLNAKKIILWDDGVKGFGVKAMRNGTKTYLLQYRMGGRSTTAKTYTLGRHGSPLTPDSARQHALDLLADVRKGIDPIKRDRASSVQLADEAYFDFDTFADRYIEKHVQAGRLRSEADIVGTFARDLRPRFRGKTVKDITAEEIKIALGDIADRSQSAANKAYKWLGGMYSWGMKKDRLSTSPMGAVGKPFPEGERTRILSKKELVALASVLSAIPRQFAALYLLLLLTGQRLREVAGMRWEEIDPVANEWLIPARRTKNKRAHIVPLSPQVRRIIEDLDWPESGVGFVLTTTGISAISGFSKLKRDIDALLATSPLFNTPMVAWVVHDMRRTFRTGCSELQIRSEHAEAAMNHVSGALGGINRVYDVYEYRKEKRLVLNRWATHVESVVGGIPSILNSRICRQSVRGSPRTG